MTYTPDNGNGHKDEEDLEISVTFEIFEDIAFSLEDEDITITDGQAIRDEIDGDEEDQSDDRN